LTASLQDLDVKLYNSGRGGKIYGTKKGEG